MSNPLYEERKNRIEMSVQLKETDRVPNLTHLGTFPLHAAGIREGDFMRDYDLACRTIVEYYKKDLPLDTANASTTKPSALVLEYLGEKTARWPGDPKGLPMEYMYQMTEDPLLFEDEYGEFMQDPAKFWLTKFLPREFSIFEGFENFTDINFFMMMGVVSQSQVFLTSPPQIEMYQRLLNAAQENLKMNQTVGKYQAQLIEMGYFNMGMIPTHTAFDMLGDRLRCTFGLLTDLYDHREEVKKLLEMFCNIQIQVSLQISKMMNSNYCAVFLHKGFDGFISEEDYAELYWPYLQKWIVAITEHGLTPYVYCEGSYTTRLKYLKDVPAGKVIYYFDEVDLKQAKQQLQGIACVAGGYPMSSLLLDTPEIIDEKIKRHLDLMAPGGGYMFLPSGTLENCPEANVEAMIEAVWKYGKY